MLERHAPDRKKFLFSLNTCMLMKTQGDTTPKRMINNKSMHPRQNTQTLLVTQHLIFYLLIHSFKFPVFAQCLLW